MYKFLDNIKSFVFFEVVFIHYRHAVMAENACISPWLQAYGIIVL